MLFGTVDTMERKSGHDPEKDLADQYFQEFIERSALNFSTTIYGVFVEKEYAMYSESHQLGLSDQVTILFT
jgi:hypothetical protein